MGEVVSNATGFVRSLEAAERKFHTMFRTRVKVLVSEGMRRMLARTPVYSGQTVMNYVATAGTPYGGGVKEGMKPVEATNKLAVGAEKLRPRAERVALATLKGVNFSHPFQDFYITNKAPQVSGLEYGELPGDPFVPRSPAGMFRITNQELILLLSSGKI